MQIGIHESVEGESVLGNFQERNCVIMNKERHMALRAELMRRLWVQRGHIYSLRIACKAIISLGSVVGGVLCTRTSEAVLGMREKI